MNRLNILIACEFSGIVRDAFIAHGHNAVSCDLESSERPGPHMQGDVLPLLTQGWDMMIAFPPCTYLCNSGARWHSKTQRQQDALDFVRVLMAAPIPHIALENPAGRISTAIRKPDQIIQPWMFSDEATKTTHLWLTNLPLLQPTQIMNHRPQLCWYMSPSLTRSKERSRTYKGIAAAMADQWSCYVNLQNAKAK